MAYAHYERLSAMDGMFLELEDANTPMHIGGVAVFEAAPLEREDGALDFERLLEFTRAQLRKSPRLRQKIATIPALAHPVWIDDERFNLLYHMRHAALPHPGDERQLKRMAARILSQQLDRTKPLWEVWFVEGLAGGRLAVVTKLHHCMADGVSSGDLMNMLMGPSAEYVPEPAGRWMPRPAPGGARMLVDELTRRVTGPLGRGGGRASGPGGPSGALFETLGRAASGAWKAAQAGLQPASPTPLNVETGPHRRFDWTHHDLDAVKEVARAAGAKLNDVALAVVAGAVRSFLGQRAVAVDPLEFRVAVPVNVRSDAERGRLGNRVSSLLVRLPLDEADPWKRLLRILDLTREAKGSGQSQAVDLVGRMADWLPLGLMARVSRFGTSGRVVNMVVTNVPGPQLPVYMLGARMLEEYPLVPLMPDQALGIALFSYDGKLFWGFDADWDAVPDLHDFVDAVDTGFETLAKTASSAA